VTYVAYSGPHEDPYIAAYNHAAGKWTGPVHAGVNPMGKSPDQVDPGELDNHGRPALIVDRQGYIHLIFGGHGGEAKFGENNFGTPGKGRQIHIISKKPGDISAWETLENISPFGTYSQWVKMSNGDLYLFYRHGSHRSDWVYQKSLDDGRTFAPVVSIIKHQTAAGSLTVHDSWYAWFDRGKGDTITASYVYHPCANPGHTAHRNNTYYMLMDKGGPGTIQDQYFGSPQLKFGYDPIYKRTELGLEAYYELYNNVQFKFSHINSAYLYRLQKGTSYTVTSLGFIWANF
jgi:hypothetical protein